MSVNATSAATVVATELQPVVDAEVVPMDKADAQRLDKAIRLLVGTIRDQFERLQAKVADAKTGEAWKALGFSSWTAYLADVLGSQPLLLPKPERRELVEFLWSEGMSQRAISAATGVSKGTVNNDLRSQLAANRSASRDEVPKTGHLTLTDDVKKTLASNRQAVADQVAQEKRTETTGLDGKVYTRPTVVPEPEKRKPPRKPLPDAYKKAAYDFHQAFERLERLTNDDRFLAHRETIYATEYGRLSTIEDRFIDLMARLMGDADV